MTSHFGSFLKGKTDIWHISCGLQMVSRETKLQRLTIWTGYTHTASTHILKTNASHTTDGWEVSSLSAREEDCKQKVK